MLQNIIQGLEFQLKLSGSEQIPVADFVNTVTNISLP
jgi:hypothetical protein